MVLVPPLMRTAGARASAAAACRLNHRRTSCNSPDCSTARRCSKHVDFPTAEVLGPDASEDQIQDLIKRHGQVFIKPLFKGGVGKKGKSGLIGRATRPAHRAGREGAALLRRAPPRQRHAKANGVTFEGGVPAEHEVYFSITDDTRFRAPTMTITHRGGVDIEELDKSEIVTVPFDALTGLKAFVVANALADIGAPREIISPLVQHLPKLWELMHHYGMTTLELNPIRMRPDGNGRLTPVACDFKCGFDRDDPRVGAARPARRTCSPPTSAPSSRRSTSCAPTRASRDVFVINEKGTILAPTFGGGANSLVTEVLGDAAIISSDFGGNPPYEKMKAGGAHLLPALPGADQRAVHHRRQVEQHRHPRDLARAWATRCASTSRPTGRRRCTWWSAAAGRTWCAAWARWPTPATRSGCPTASSASTARSPRS